MARKKKTKAELKEERQRAMEAKRRETGWEMPEPEPDMPRAVEDARALFPDFGSPASAQAEASSYLLAIVDSDWMIDEPEFEAIYLSPTELAAQYVEAAGAAGFDPDSLAVLDEEERVEKHAGFLSTAIDDVLTGALEEDILDAIDGLRERLIEAGEREQAARAGLVLDFLEQEESTAMWSSVGVVAALGQRSLEAGFALAAAAQEAKGAVTRDGVELVPEVQAVLDRYPGLARFMAVQQDRAWENGLVSLYRGDLELGLFREDELEPQLETWERVLELDEAGEEEEVEALVQEISQYATGLLTAERIGQILDEFDALLESGKLGRDDEVFVGMVGAALTDRDSVTLGAGALVAAFVGELSLRLEEVQDEEPGEDDE